MPNKKNHKEIKTYEEQQLVVSEINRKLSFLKTIAERHDKKSEDFRKKHAEDINYLYDFYARTIRTGSSNLGRTQTFYAIFERFNNGTLENICKDMKAEDRREFGSPEDFLNDLKQVCLFHKEEYRTQTKKFPNAAFSLTFDDIAAKADPDFWMTDAPLDNPKKMEPRNLIKVLDENNRRIDAAPITLASMTFKKIKTSSDSDEYTKMIDKLNQVTRKITKVYKRLSDDARLQNQEALCNEIFSELCELNLLAHDYMQHAKTSSLSRFSNKNARKQKMAATECLIRALNDLTLDITGYDRGSISFRKEIDDAYKIAEEKKPDNNAKAVDNKKVVKNNKAPLQVALTDESWKYVRYATVRTSASVLKNQMALDFIDRKASEWTPEQREKYCCDLFVNSVLTTAMAEKDYTHPLIHCMLKEGGNIDTARQMVRGMQKYQNFVSNITSPKKFLKVADSPSKCKELATALKADFSKKERAELRMEKGKLKYTNMKPLQADAMRIVA